MAGPSFHKISVRKFRQSLIYQTYYGHPSRDTDDRDAGKWFTPVEITDMSRRELQKWCKKLGIRANTKTIQMQAELLDFHQNILSNSDILRHPFLPMQHPISYPGQNSMQNSQTNNMTSSVRQENLFFNNNLNVSISTDQGLRQIRHYKNSPFAVHNGSYEDAEFYSERIDSFNSQPSGDKLPSVSKILRSTAPKSKIFAISNWTKKQKELLGEDVFQQKINEIKKKGVEFHNFVHQCIGNGQLHSEVPEKLHGYLKSTQKVFDNLDDAIATEKCVRHANLGYQGKLDMLACYHGNTCIIEWKTSHRRKSSLADCGEYPMQMMAYAGAVNSDSTSRIQIQHGLLVIAYEDGAPADTHFLDLKQCRTFWQDWLVRLYKFKHG